LNHLLSKNRIIETHFKTLLENSQKKTERLMTEMRSINELSATDGEIHAVATNLVMIVTFWHSYAYVMNPRKLDEEKAMNQGVFQVMVLLAPYLQGDARLLFEKLAAEYR
jgi:hypothetical protein